MTIINCHLAAAARCGNSQKRMHYEAVSEWKLCRAGCRLRRNWITCCDGSAQLDWLFTPAEDRALCGVGRISRQAFILSETYARTRARAHARAHTHTQTKRRRAPQTEFHKFRRYNEGTLLVTWEIKKYFLEILKTLIL